MPIPEGAAFQVSQKYVESTPDSSRKGSKMVKYPIRVPRDYYQGRQPARQRKAAKHNELAKLLETHLNQQIEANNEPIQQYVYGFIAHDLGLDEEQVRNVLFAANCGHTGLTVVKDAV